MIRIIVDEEFGAESWWDAARERADCPPALRALLHNVSDWEIEVTEEEAAQIEAWCKSIPGWNDGTAYASHPLLFNPAD